MTLCSLLGAIRSLIDLKRDIAAGLYFMSSPPHYPLAYIRTEEGFYRNLDHYTAGSLVEVDAVGMGCTLIHKSVYQRIMDTHEVFLRPNASMVVVSKNDIIIDPHAPDYDRMIVSNNTLVTPLAKPAEDDNRPWPFYLMEYMRTEDLHFAELCHHTGIKTYVDTTITCDHWKTLSVNYDSYREHLHERKKVPSP